MENRIDAIYARQSVDRKDSKERETEKKQVKKSEETGCPAISSRIALGRSSSRSFAISPKRYRKFSQHAANCPWNFRNQRLQCGIIGKTSSSLSYSTPACITRLSEIAEYKPEPKKGKAAKQLGC